MRSFPMILTGAALLLSSMSQSAVALPVASTSSLARADQSSGANQLVQPLAPNKARRSNKKSKKAKKREEEPSIFQVEIPLDMMSDSVIARPSSAEIEAAHSTHQPIYVEIDDEQQSALAGGNMLLGLPEGEEVVFINVDKHERLARRSEALREMDDVLASME